MFDAKMTERAKLILKLKGVEQENDSVSENLENVQVDLERLNAQINSLPKIKLNQQPFRRINFKWNMDDTLDSLVIDGVAVLHFVWNADGSLGSIIREAKQ